MGPRWSEISKKITGRPENKIKNRFYSFIEKNYHIKLKYIDLDKSKAPGTTVEILDQQNEPISNIRTLNFENFYK